MSLYLKKLSKNFTKGLSGGKQILFHSMITYCGVATAGFLNSFCMRMGEMRSGIKVFDKHGEDMGVSKNCAKQAVV